MTSTKRLYVNHLGLVHTYTGNFEYGLKKKNPVHIKTHAKATGGDTTLTV